MHSYPQLHNTTTDESHTKSPEHRSLREATTIIFVVVVVVIVVVVVVVLAPASKCELEILSVSPL